MCAKRLVSMVRAFGAVVGIAWALSGNEAIGQDPLFLPGDAYFRARLSKGTVTRLLEENDAPLTLLYNSDTGEDLSPIGYATIQIDGCSRKMRKRLMFVYERIAQLRPMEVQIIRDGEKERLREINGPLVFVYNKAFEFGISRCCLRYNEQWAEDQADLGLPDLLTGYYIDDERLFSIAIEDWKMSRRVKPLKVRLPPREPKFIQEAPVVAESENVVLLILPYESDVLRMRKGEFSQVCYLVSEDGIRKVSISDGEWRSDPLNEDTN